jgi:diguanylate cyclase (GGDEF)-like protein
MDTSRTQKRKWLVEFAAISLVPILLLGVVLEQAMRGNAREKGLAEATNEAALVSRLGFERQLAPEDLRTVLGPDQQEALDGALRAASTADAVKRSTVRNADLMVVYSTDRKLVGRTGGPAAQLRQALEGSIVSRISSESNGKVLDVFVPMSFGTDGPPAGVNELKLPYKPIAASITKETRRIYPTLFVGLLVLYLTMLAVVSGASARLRRRAADKEQAALADALTGLANRTAFQNLVHRALLAARRRDTLVAVMLMDLDRFKEVNDTLGHHNGDLLLQRIASRLEGVLREGETVARLGGDEFAILLPDVPHRGAVAQVAKRFMKVLEEPVAVGGLALQVDASIGIALYPEHGHHVEALTRTADVAMYKAKESRSGFEFYNEEHNRNDAGRLALVGELRRAIDEGELVFYYQPKVDLQSGRIAGVEALARWEHPRRGLLPPDEFVPLAERSSLLRAMTVHLIDTALRQCSVWRAQGIEMNVAVNLSTQNLLDLQLPSDLDRLLSSWRLPPGSLEFEITESTIMGDTRRAMAILTKLSQIGVRLSVDDFGTGYSSLSYLKQLPVSALKIDKSFVMTMNEDDGNAMIVQSTIDLGHNLGLQVVAEGVESEKVYSQLAALGCDYGQGYFLSRPLPPDKMTRWLEVFAQPPAAAPLLSAGPALDPEPVVTDDALKEWIIG